MLRLVLLVFGFFILQSCESLDFCEDNMLNKVGYYVE